MSTATSHDVAASAGRAWRITGWSLVPPSAAAVLAGAWASSVPGGYFEVGIWAVLAWLVLAACWLTVAIVTLVRDIRAHRLRERATGYWRLGLVPALFVLGLLITGLDLAQRARFELDRTELDAYAAEVRAGRVDARQAGQTGRIGTLPVSSVQDREGCVSFTVDGAGFLGQNGYAHCTGNPPDESGYNFTHVAGPWYTWYFTD